MPVRWNTATPSAEVVTTSVGVDSAGSLSVTCAPARAADCGSTTLILSSAAEAAASKRMKHEKTRENRMHSSFSRERGLVWTVRAGLLAWRVRTLRGDFAHEFQYPAIATGLPRITPGDRRQFPRLQLRGSAGFSPASQSSSRRGRANQRNVGKEREQR